jgi:hypothetical protein
MELTSAVGAYLVALLVTVAGAFIAMVALNRPLRRFLARAAPSPERTDLLTRVMQVLLVLLPAVALTMSAGIARDIPEGSVFFRVLLHLAWSGAGLTVGVIGVAVWALGVEGNRGGVVHLPPERLDDLQRLLAKVEHLRARELVGRE